MRDGIPLVTFDATTAAAVVAVLTRAGIGAWVAAGTDGGEAEVWVAEADRERALSTLAARMEEVREEVLQSTPPGERPRRLRRAAWDADDDVGPVAPGDVDDELRSGPPLVMERFRSLSGAMVVLLTPLLVITLAQAPFGRTARTAILLTLAGVVAGWLLLRRRR